MTDRTDRQQLRNRTTRHIGQSADILRSIESGAPYRYLCGIEGRASKADYPMVGGRICGACVEVYRNLLPGDPLPDGNRSLDDIKRDLDAQDAYQPRFGGRWNWPEWPEVA